MSRALIREILGKREGQKIVGRLCEAPMLFAVVAEPCGRRVLTVFAGRRSVTIELSKSAASQLATLLTRKVRSGSRS